MPSGRLRDLLVPAHRASAHARVCDHPGPSGHSRCRAHPFCLPSAERRRHPGRGYFRGSMAGLCAPLSTLRRGPHRPLRMTRGRCGSLLLHWLGDKGGRRTGYADFGRFLFHVTGIDHPSHGRLPRRHGDGAAAGLGRRSAAFSRTSRYRFVPGRFCSAGVVGDCRHSCRRSPGRKRVAVGRWSGPVGGRYLRILDQYADAFSRTCKDC